MKCNKLQLSLLGLSSQVRHENIAQFISCLVEVVAHAVRAETLADDVEVKARLNQYGRNIRWDRDGWVLTCSR